MFNFSNQYCPASKAFINCTFNSLALTGFALSLCGAGCGINVSNSQPTLCINDIAKVASRSTTQGHLRPLTREEIIAKSLNELEFLVAMFQGGGVNMILQDYYKYWLHG